MTEGNFTTWNKAHEEIRFLISHTNRDKNTITFDDYISNKWFSLP